MPDDMAALCLHVVTGDAFPRATTGARIYRSRVDEDGLGSSELYAGREDLTASWYGRFWRRFWFEQFTGCASQVPVQADVPPDLTEVLTLLDHLTPLAAGLVSTAEELVRLTTRRPLPIRALQEMQGREGRARQKVVGLSMQSPATASLAVALVRDTHNDEGSELTGMAQARLATYRRWQKRLHTIATYFRSLQKPHSLTDRGRSRILPMAQSA